MDAEKITKRGETLSRLNGEPIEGTSHIDSPDRASAEPVSECVWAPLHLYVVKAVNALGQESGPSPATPSIPSAPSHVVAAPLEDGRVLVISKETDPAPGGGQYLFRMDSYKPDWAFRMSGSPHPGTVFVDIQRWPTGDRRAYFVIGVDGAGQLGAPSAPAWSRRMP